MPDIAQMDMRVGKILEVWQHPKREQIFCEKVDVGNGEIRTIASGLVGIVPIEELKDRMVVLLLNLKPRKMDDFESQGMVLCANSPDKSVIEVLTPPEGAAPGDFIEFEGYVRNPPAKLPNNKNAWERVQPALKVSSEGVAMWTEVPFTVLGKGVVTTTTLKQGGIS